MRADRIGDDRQPGRLILKDLQPALAAAPEVVGNPAHANLSRRDLACFGLLVPRNRNHGNRKRIGKSVANDPQPQLRKCLAPAVPRSDVIVPAPGACSPTQSRQGRDGPRPTSGARSGRARGSTQVGITWTRSTLAPSRRAQSARKSLPATTVSAARTVSAKRRRPPVTLRTAPVVRVAEHDGVVEIENQVPRSTGAGCAIAMLARVSVARITASNSRRPAELEGTKQSPRSNPRTSGTSPRPEETAQRPDPVAATDVVRRFDQSE